MVVGRLLWGWFLLGVCLHSYTEKEIRFRLKPF